MFLKKGGRTGFSMQFVNIFVKCRYVHVHIVYM